MNCCIHCFIDPEIRSIIEAANNKSHCDFCGRYDTQVIDLDTNKTLADMFNGLLDVYTKSSDLPLLYPQDKLDLLKNILHDDWHIFTCDAETIYRLLICICRERYSSDHELFDSPVGISELCNKDYLTQSSIIGTHSWEDFLAEIKTKNRFHTDILNTKVLDQFLEPLRKKYEKGHIFYRARISPSDKGFNIDEMGAPPAKYASAGRANPEGISRLYIADSFETAIHEIRAAAYDFVTIGRFVLLDEIEVINFTMIDKISPFFGIDFTQQAINLKHLKRIGSEIAKPLRRHDSQLDYLPTQYICDYIKSRGFIGVEYISAIHPGGYNLAIFEDSRIQCISTAVYEVESLSYTYKIHREI